MKNDIIAKANNILDFKQKPIVGFSPGRVNLIGEHLDYNGGYVLPCTLDIGTYGVAALRSDRWVCCYSANFPYKGTVKFNLDRLIYQKDDAWANYVKGIVKELRPEYGFDLFVQGNIPPGAGLSSSASLEILVGTMVNTLFNLHYSRLDIVKMAQKAENNFIGVQSGIMDQFVIGMTCKKAAMLLNTNTLEYRFIDVNLKDYSLIIGNTNKSRALQDSKYNERRNECRCGLKLLRKKYPIANLCELSLNDLKDSNDIIADKLIYRRVRHVISENERTLAAYNALKNGDLPYFGELLNQSHQSLRNDYEVTGFELDTMVSLFQKYGSIGARMTGAGFGGCMIALVPNQTKDKIAEKVKADYEKITKLVPELYKIQIEDGAKIL